MKVIQLLDSRMDNFSYVVYDESSKEAAVIDPSFDGEKIINEVRLKGLNPKYIILTHEHFDHVHSAGDLRSSLKAKIVVHENAKVELKVDKRVKDNDVLSLGKASLKILHTPGHTPGSICILARDKLFTGDTLFVGNMGRTDLPGSSPEEMKKSIGRIKRLPDSIIIYPGHHYGSTKTSTIGREKKNNRFFRF
ncbi:MAG TPA: MBL fold metallo-hydrolase [Candidatus Nanoarchaeia archaeon]|nr:MBL fold metallo-hydrolase [Candidatus Nanoarchaeia archaeon]